MTEISPVSGTSAATASAAARNQDTLRGMTSDFETFLRMLTAQAQYQDPLNPIDSAEYAAQLAQFSMVEQQVQTNDLLQSLLGDRDQSGLTSLGSWIGMDVRSPARANFAGDPVTIPTELAAGASEGILVVKSENGQPLRRIDFAIGDSSVTWDGRDGDAAQVPFGTYSFEIESWRDGARLSVAPAQQYDTVREAQIADGTTYLVLQDGRRIEANSVTALRGA